MPMAGHQPTTIPRADKADNAVIDLTLSDDDDNHTPAIPPTSAAANTTLCVETENVQTNGTQMKPPPTDDDHDDIEFVSEVRHSHFTSDQLTEWHYALLNVANGAYAVLSAAEGAACLHRTQPLPHARAVEVLLRIGRDMGATAFAELVTCASRNPKSLRSRHRPPVAVPVVAFPSFAEKDQPAEHVVMHLKVGEMVRISRAAMRRLLGRAFDEVFSGKVFKLKDSIPIVGEEKRRAVEARDEYAMKRRSAYLARRSENRFRRRIEKRRKANAEDSARYNNWVASTAHLRASSQPAVNAQRAADETPPPNSAGGKENARVHSPALVGTTNSATGAPSTAKRSKSTPASTRVPNSPTSPIMRDSEADVAPPADAQAAQPNRGFTLLQRMGWRQGTGLGTDGTGRVDPVKAKARNYRAGLGR